MDIDFSLASVGTNESTPDQFMNIFELVLNIVPGNLIQPFVEDDLLQIVDLGIFFEILLLLFKPKIQIIGKLLNDPNGIINLTMSTICNPIPLFVFLRISNIVLKGEFFQFFDVWQIILISLLTIASLLVIMPIKAKLSRRVP